MAYSNKLDTNVVREYQKIDPTNGTLMTAFIGTTATIELAEVKAYYTYVNAQGAIYLTYTTLVMVGGQSIVVEETHAAIDTLINP